MYGDQTNFPKIIPVQVLSDIYSSLGNKYIPYNKFMPEALTRIDTQQTDDKNIYPDSVVSNTDKCDIKHSGTPTKNVPNTDKSNIKYTIITPTQHGLADSILSQSYIIQVHQ